MEVLEIQTVYQIHDYKIQIKNCIRDTKEKKSYNRSSVR